VRLALLGVDLAAGREEMIICIIVAWVTIIRFATCKETWQGREW
jgi:hypothetical protein